MKVKIIENNEKKAAVCESMEAVIIDGQSALDFIVNIGYEYDCRNITINKASITEDFFKLSTGIAGEVAQKLVNYGYRLAIIGDFSNYESKPLHDYMYECNNGGYLYFVKDEADAFKKLIL